MKAYDIVIVGGGLVGTTLAIALKNSPWHVALVEAYIPQQHQQATEDMRSIALSYASQKILEKLQLWKPIENSSTSIEKIHISEEKRFGKTVLDSKALGLKPFAHVTPIPNLYQTLQDSLESSNQKSNIHLIRPATVSHIEHRHSRESGNLKNMARTLDSRFRGNDGKWELDINSDGSIQKIQSTLLIAADGDRSFIREALNLPTEKIDYHQTAIVTTALTSLGHNNIAYERFTSKGVLAILPLQNHRVAAIWTTDNQYSEDIQNNLLDKIQQTIGYRLGKFSNLGKIQTYPLKELHAETQTIPGLFLLGNAAHVLHPIAAQGLNLSLRDVDVLAKLLQTATDLNNPEISENYLKLRNPDQQQTEKFTDRLLKLFTPQFLPISILRSLGLLAFDLMPAVKRDFCLKRMGLA